MNTFEAISHIRRQSLNRTEAMKFLIERLGFTVTYAGEIVAVIFAEPASGNPAVFPNSPGI